MTNADLSRRCVLGVLGSGAAATVLAGCGGGTADSGSSAGSSSGSGGAGGGTGTALIATADVPVGSGVILKDQELVVTQPTEGTFLAFSAICTHQGCPVGTITGDQILCPCHGSVFSAKDGSVVDGPAEAPLAAVKVSVEGDQVVQA